MKYQISIEGGTAFTVAAEEDTLLRGALRAGMALPHECSVGGCGACRFDLVDGLMESVWPEAPGLSERDRKRGKYLACQSRPLGDCTIRVRCDESYRPAVRAHRSAAELMARRALTPDMSEFTFRVPGATEFRPGQYALLYPPRAPGARAYSMANLPNKEGIWKFVIRRVPGGSGSNALFDQVGIGESIVFDGPYGHAYLREDSPRDIVCIAGGSGLAPMLSVARGALAGGGSRRVHFFYGARGQADLGALDALEKLAEDERLALSVVLSAPESTWKGPTGFVHEEVERNLTAPLGSYDFYFAGPPPMIEAIQALLMHKHQVPFGQIRFDRFV